jgi:hypothetical protein
MSTDEMPRRPEAITLTPGEQSRVLEQARARHAACGRCGNAEFAVGDALYLGFLFRSEDPDAYMVALTCTNPACPVRHTGIRLHRAQFLSEASPRPEP